MVTQVDLQHRNSIKDIGEFIFKNLLLKVGITLVKIDIFDISSQII